MEKDIYSLKLHESIVDGPYVIKRVPGGWIYAMSLSGNVDGVVFVPFNKEFKESSKQPELPIKRTIENRKLDFLESLKSLSKKYNRNVLDEFILYWTEPNQNKTKMKFELEKTWDNSRRLSTWEKRSNQFKKPEANETGNKINW